MTYTSTFFAAEIVASLPGSNTLHVDRGFATRPHMALSKQQNTIQSTGTIYVSDTGYRSSSSDPQGVVSYRARISEAIMLTRTVGLAPGDDSVSVSWGSLSLSNLDRAYDALAASWNNDGRSITILHGAKTYDPSRGYWVDPAYSTLLPLFGGISTAWSLTDAELVIPMRDATYWLDRPIQTNQYGGTGGLDGTSSLAGVLIPKTRGAAWNVSPVLVDPAHLIYQYTDGPGTIAALWEGGKATYTNAGDTTDLYSGSTPAGQYRTDNARGLFQLGTSPTYTITVDVTGAFPIAGNKTRLADIAYYLLTEDAGLSTAYVDSANFAAVATSYGAEGGWYFGPDANMTGVSALQPILAGIGAKLVPQRNGKLGLFVLRALTGAETPDASLGPDNVVSVTPRSLPSTVSPPPYRLRIGYQHNNTTQTSGLNPTADAAMVQYVAASDLYGGWSSTTVLAAYSRPNDPSPVVTGLSAQADAASLASALGDIWGARTRLFDVVLPLDVGLPLDIGSIVRLTWPMDDLGSGRLGQIVGDNIRTSEDTITLSVLV